MKNKVIPAIIIFLCVVTFVSCKKKVEISVPYLTTGELSGLSNHQVTCTGEVWQDGGAAVTERGICWNTSDNPMVTDFKTVEGSGKGAFTSQISTLDSNTTYYIRAYATNSAGTSYGKILKFKTYTGYISDIDGNVYPTVTIGTQIWMASNLKTTKFRDGATIANGNSPVIWSGTGASYCWYENDYTLYGSSYGALYNWYAISNSKLAPTGWHVPSKAEWITLSNTLGGANIAGGKLKEEDVFHWQSPNFNATNEYGFTALPGGTRSQQGDFSDLTVFGFWWNTDATPFMIYYDDQALTEGSLVSVGSGYSVRCIKN